MNTGHSPDPAVASLREVFPLDNSALPRLLTPRPSGTAGRTTFSYKGVNVGIPVANAPALLNRDYAITAKVTVPAGGAQSMIATMGGRFGGYAPYLQESTPVFVYSVLDLKRYRSEGGIGADEWLGSGLSPGMHTIVFDFKYDGPGLGKSGTGTLTVDGRAVSTRAALPFNFRGTIDELAYRLGPEQLTAADAKTLERARLAKSTSD